MKISGFLSGTMTVFCFAGGALVPAPASSSSALPPWEAGKWRFFGDPQRLRPRYRRHGKLRGRHAQQRHPCQHARRPQPSQNDVPGVARCAQRPLGHLQRRLLRGPRRSHVADARFLARQHRPTRQYHHGTEPRHRPRSGRWPASTGSCPTPHGPWTCSPARDCWTSRRRSGFRSTAVSAPSPCPGRSGSKKVSDSLWDGIVGVKGRYTFTDDRKWFLPFYLDVGTGQTKLTWQAIAGVGYGFHWGDLVATYRYIDWTAKSGKSVEGLSLGGPMIQRDVALVSVLGVLADHAVPAAP